MLQELKSKLSIQNIKSNIIFVISGLFFCFIIFRFEKIPEFLTLLILMSTIFISAISKTVKQKFDTYCLSIKICSYLSALIISAVSIHKFALNWLPSRMIANFADYLHISSYAFLITISSVMAVLSFYFLVILCGMIAFEVTQTLIETIPFRTKSETLNNIKCNILLVISSFAFSVCNVQFDFNSRISFLISLLLILVFYSQIQDIGKKIKKIPFAVKMFSAVSAMGICYYSKNIFLDTVFNSNKISALLVSIGFNKIWFYRILSMPIFLLSYIAVFAFVSILINFVFAKLKPLLCSLSKMETVVYLSIIILLCTYTYYAFMGSNAFWGTNFKYDIIYTSDSPDLVSSNVYLRLFHPENDLRQPLFAIFSAPFVGFGYTLSIPLSYISNSFTPMFMDFIQIVMMILANLMLAKALKLNSVGRICFMIFTATTYTCLLFSIMMEQYIVAYFWLVFAVYSYVESENNEHIGLIGACGTLMTSCTLLLLPQRNKLINSIKQYIKNIEQNAFLFALTLLSFQRMDIILDFFSKTNYLLVLSGGESIYGRINQYLSFVSSCFIFPAITICKGKYAPISYQLDGSNITTISILGIIITILCVLSITLNRKNLLTKISGAWFVFSFILLCIVGWGSPENGMILYSLYFGWSYIVLLFQLIEWLSDKINSKMLLPTVSIIATIIMLIINYNGIKELLDFAFTYYPI